MAHEPDAIEREVQRRGRGTVQPLGLGRHLHEILTNVLDRNLGAIDARRPEVHAGTRGAAGAAATGRGGCRCVAALLSAHLLLELRAPAHGAREPLHGACGAHRSRGTVHEGSVFVRVCGREVDRERGRLQTRARERARRPTLQFCRSEWWGWIERIDG